jgi:hypothetical protein
LLEKETTRQGALAVLAAEIEQSGQAQERLQAFLDELE